MPAYYFDSSGIAKQYATETGSGWVRSIVAEDENTIIMIRAAINLTQEHKLRGYDAVQLATALAVNAGLLQKNLPPLTFVAADEDLLEAAEAEGLPTENPNLYP